MSLTQRWEERVSSREALTQQQQSAGGQHADREAGRGEPGLQQEAGSADREGEDRGREGADVGQAGESCAFPSNADRTHHVGILAAEVYFPQTYVSQADLEAHDGVAPGKYTAGLGQAGMAFCGDREDVVSMSLTALQLLLEKHGVSPDAVGRLEVGSESGLDHSKSLKTFLMQLFPGNHDIEGADSVSACYGGTAALLNAVNWVESRAWDGRYAVVVASDIAMYAAGPARPSGGCGAVALLIGPDAPLDLERGCAASHMAHAYDFYRPKGLYPLVDGKHSVACYLAALDACYAALVAKHAAQQAQQAQGGSAPWGSGMRLLRPSAAAAAGAGAAPRSVHAPPQSRFERGRAQRAQQGQAAGPAAGRPPFTLADVDFCVMHAPFVKMVRKAYARLVYQDALRLAAGGGAVAQRSAGAAGSPAQHSAPQHGQGRPEAAPGAPAAEAAGGAGAGQVHQQAAADSRPGVAAGSSSSGCSNLAPLTLPPPHREPRELSPASGPHRDEAFREGSAGGREAVGSPAERPQQQQQQQPQQQQGSASSPVKVIATRRLGSLREVGARYVSAAAEDGLHSAFSGMLLGPGDGESDAAAAAAAAAGSAAAAGAVPAAEDAPPGSPLALAAAFPADPGAFPEASYADRRLDAAAKAASAPGFERMVAPSLRLAADCGNMYAASVHGGLCALVEAEGEELVGKRILLYSYGSGLAASLLAVVGRHTAESGFTLAGLQRQLQIGERLAARTRRAPADFIATLLLLERRFEAADWTPSCSLEELRPGTFYLERVDELHRRTYARKPLK